jgi:dihydrolipoamide dehydrogenase
VREIPSRILLIGGSAVGTELGTFYARMGLAVTIVQRAGRLIDREDPRVGALTEQALAADGVTVRTGHRRTPRRHHRPAAAGRHRPASCRYRPYRVSLAGSRMSMAA